MNGQTHIKSHLLLCGRLTEVGTYNTSDNNSFSRR